MNRVNCIVLREMCSFGRLVEDAFSIDVKVRTQSVCCSTALWHLAECKTKNGSQGTSLLRSCNSAW